MLNNLLSNVDRIFLAYGATDFRKQTSSLCSIVQNTFNMNPYDRSAYIFCNRKRNSGSIINVGVVIKITTSTFIIEPK